jgi:hypothetical protein
MAFSRTSPQGRIIIFLTITGIVALPLVGAYVCFRDTGFPPDYFSFPPIKEVRKPGLNITAILISAAIFVILFTLYFFPKVFGFRNTSVKGNTVLSVQSPPWWLWVGLILWGSAITAFALNAAGPKWFTNWSFLPLCWGFILILDGAVYMVNNKESLLRKDPVKMAQIAAASISGWLIYEYLNIFIQFNWYYPRVSGLMSFTQFRIYSILGSSAFIPMAFETYDLLIKLRPLNTRYSNGPKIVIPNWLNILLLILFSYLLYQTPFQPDHLFFMVWVAPIVIVAIVLKHLNIDTPFSPVRQGDWTFLLVFALTFLIQGIFLEWWNKISEEVLSNGDVTSNNPTNWIYMIPYVHVMEVFRMPFFGYMGYLFFSIHCWLWWTVIKHLVFPKSRYNLGNDDYL